METRKRHDCPVLKDRSRMIWSFVGRSQIHRDGKSMTSIVKQRQTKVSAKPYVSQTSYALDVRVGFSGFNSHITTDMSRTLLSTYMGIRRFPILLAYA